MMGEASHPLSHKSTHEHGHVISRNYSLRSCLAIFKDVSSQLKCRDALLEWGLLDYLLQD